MSWLVPGFHSNDLQEEQHALFRRVLGPFGNPQVHLQQLSFQEEPLGLSMPDQFSPALWSHPRRMGPCLLKRQLLQRQPKSWIFRHRLATVRAKGVDRLR